MQTILIVFHLFLAIGLIGLILIQHGKGADMGAAFGSGASGTVFGAKGSASFLTRLTAGLATLFFITSMVMAYFATQRDEGSDLLQGLQTPAVEEQAQTQSDIPPIPGSTPAGNEVPPVPVSGEPVQTLVPPTSVDAQQEAAAQTEAVAQPEAQATAPGGEVPQAGTESNQAKE